ncbi:MAG: tetratricopeptide repeat protein, partial [Acidobacteriota bacterium]|nr:tetratricopeptide repeat protein [Acidobacteriota bacterium]
MVHRVGTSIGAAGSTFFLERVTLPDQSEGSSMNTQMKCCAQFIAIILAVCLGAQPAFAQSSAQLTDKGRVALVNRQFDIALSDLNKAIEADALNPIAHYYRGQVLGNLGREQEALDAFLKAAELNPGWGEAHRMATVAALNTSNLPVAWEQAV